MRETLVHQRQDGFQVARPRQPLLRAPVPRADRGSKIEQAHRLDGIGGLQRRARFRIRRLEYLVDFVQQRFDDLDGFAVFLRRRAIVAAEVGLVALGIDRLRPRKSQPAPALHGAAFQRIHLGQ